MKDIGAERELSEIEYITELVSYPERDSCCLVTLLEKDLSKNDHKKLVNWSRVSNMELCPGDLTLKT